MIIPNEEERFLRSKRIRAEIFFSYDGKCAICECELDESFHIDHIIPWSKNGKTNLFNLQPTCKKCNLKKGNEYEK